MQLAKASECHIAELATWFTDKTALTDWAGPNFRYPFTPHTFFADLRLAKLPSYALLNSESTMVAFGQYYLRLGRCHLGRLVVNPDYRGRGIVKTLIDQLCEKGAAQLATKEISLFVLAHNFNAITAYTNCGFRAEKYPEPLPLKNCIYMVKQLAN